MEHNDTPKDSTEKEYKPYVSSRLRSKMEEDYEEEKEKGPAATIAVVGLIAVIVICGGLFLLGQNSKKNQAGQTAEASHAPDPAAAGMPDSAALADSLARLAAADSMARLASQTTAPQTPTPAVKRPATPLPGSAPATDAAPPPAASPTRYGIAVGSYLFDDKAASEKDRLAGATSLEGTVFEKSEGGATTYQVVLGSFESRAEAETKGAELLGAGTVRESRVVPLKRK